MSKKHRNKQKELPMTKDGKYEQHNKALTGYKPTNKYETLLI